MIQDLPWRVVELAGSFGVLLFKAQNNQARSLHVAERWHQRRPWHLDGPQRCIGALDVVGWAVQNLGALGSGKNPLSGISWMPDLKIQFWVDGTGSYPTRFPFGDPTGMAQTMCLVELWSVGPQGRRRCVPGIQDQGWTDWIRLDWTELEWADMD